MVSVKLHADIVQLKSVKTVETLETCLLRQHRPNAIGGFMAADMRPNSVIENIAFKSILPK